VKWFASRGEVNGEKRRGKRGDTETCFAPQAIPTPRNLIPRDWLHRTRFCPLVGIPADELCGKKRNRDLVVPGNRVAVAALFSRSSHDIR